MATRNVARRHHFVPQAYLAGFTNSGAKDGQLYVLEAETGRSFRTSPKNVAVEMDFNRIDVEGYRSDYVENALAPLEQSAVEAIARTSASREFPSDADYSAILHLMALLFIRNPRTRRSFNRAREHSVRVISSSFVSNEAIFKYQVAKAREAGERIPESLSFREMREFVEADRYEIHFHPQSNLRVELGIFEEVIRMLHERKWSLIRAPSDSESFICCDHPVALTHKSRRNIPCGLATRNTSIFFPLTRRIGFYGVFEQALVPVVEARSRNVAIMNEYLVTNAMKHIYSANSDFVIWADDKIQAVHMHT